MRTKVVGGHIDSHAVNHEPGVRFDTAIASARADSEHGLAVAQEPPEDEARAQAVVVAPENMPIEELDYPNHVAVVAREAKSTAGGRVGLQHFDAQAFAEDREGLRATKRSVNDHRPHDDLRTLAEEPTRAPQP